MNKPALLTVLFVLMLSACGGVNTSSPNGPDEPISQLAVETDEIKATLPNNPDAKESQAIVEKWIEAYQTNNAEMLLSLWSDDITWTACATSPCDSYKLQALKNFVPRDFKTPKFSVKIQSYLITMSGDFAIVQTLYADPRVGLPTPVPAVAILEFENGKISSEKWYW